MGSELGLQGNLAILPGPGPLTPPVLFPCTPLPPLSLVLPQPRMPAEYLPAAGLQPVQALMGVT